MACGRETPRRVPARSAAATPVSTEQVRDLDIQFYRARAARDPSGAFDLAQLAGLYLQRARETGDPRDAQRAEQAARRSLRNRRARNDKAMHILVASLLSQHRFSDALGRAQQLYKSDTTSPEARATLGEIQMELGSYDAARTTFAALTPYVRNLSVAPRLARWAELQGHMEQARELLRVARIDAMHTPSMPREQAAWFWLRSGDLELRTGHLDEAERDYRAALSVRPDDYRVLAALTHLETARGRWAQAVDYGTRAIASNLDPATLGLLSDASLAMGDTAQATEYARVLDVAVTHQPGAYHRAWSLFLLDHNRHVALVSRKIREELRQRRDIYGYDLLAWSLHKQGRDAEARRAMTVALEQGTQDAQLFYHAGMISAGLHDSAATRQYLSRALAVNPFFNLSQAADVRATLITLH